MIFPSQMDLYIDEAQGMLIDMTIHVMDVKAKPYFPAQIDNLAHEMRRMQRVIGKAHQSFLKGLPNTLVLQVTT